MLMHLLLRLECSWATGRQSLRTGYSSSIKSRSLAHKRQCVHRGPEQRVISRITHVSIGSPCSIRKIPKSSVVNRTSRCLDGFYTQPCSPRYVQFATCKPSTSTEVRAFIDQDQHHYAAEYPRYPLVAIPVWFHLNACFFEAHFLGPNGDERICHHIKHERPKQLGRVRWTAR